MPPMKMKPAIKMMKTPETQLGILKALWKEVVIELACTILPIKPKAMMMRSEKIVAKVLEPKPLEI